MSACFGYMQFIYQGELPLCVSNKSKDEINIWLDDTIDKVIKSLNGLKFPIVTLDCCSSILYQFISRLRNKILFESHPQSGYRSGTEVSGYDYNHI